LIEKDAVTQKLQVLSIYGLTHIVGAISNKYGIVGAISICIAAAISIAAGSFVADKMCLK
jgi:hypothetical protein